jgi:aldose sugar dehydrogenase
MTIVRGKINKDNEWLEEQMVFRSPPPLFVASGVHFGSRFQWDKQGHLFFTLGERGTMQNAQDLTNTLGKIHRINDYGTVPEDNLFVNTPGAVGSIWSLGHRNPQGLTWNPVAGKLWESEHGLTGGDEIDIIEPGHKYGWRIATKAARGRNHEKIRAGSSSTIRRLRPAGFLSIPAISTRVGKIPACLVDALVGSELRRLEVSGDKVTHQEIAFDQFGRVHTVVQVPDGYLYVAIQSPTGVNGIPLAASTPGWIIRLMAMQ